MFFSKLRQGAKKKSTARQNRRWRKDCSAGGNFRPSLELLEDRLAPAAITTPLVTITSLGQYGPIIDSLGQFTSISDGVSFYPQTSLGSYSSSGFSGMIQNGDTIHVRFQAPASQLFAIHKLAGTNSESFFVNAHWLSGTDVISTFDNATATYENAQGSVPIPSYALSGVGDAGNAIEVQYIATVTGDFSFTAVDFEFHVNNSPPPIPQTYGSVESFSYPSFGAGATGPSATFPGNNPAPMSLLNQPGTTAITSLSPNSVQEGSGDVLVTVAGTNFLTGATVQVNGTSLAATVGSSSQLQVTVPASFFAEETTLSVSVTNPSTTSPSNALSLPVLDATLTASATTINATEGAALSNVLVATFTDQDPAGAASDYSAVIDWGDGDATVPGSISIQADAQVAGQFDVYTSKTNPFAEEGSQPVTVTITDNQASTIAESTTVIADAALSGSPVAVNPIAGAPFSGPVASFTDADPKGTAGDYSATISWGNGKTSSGTIAPNGLGGFTVSGDITYASVGTYTVHVTIQDAGGAMTSADSTANVTLLGIGVQNGESAGGGYWKSKNGQALIQSFNGSSTSTDLSTWLATMFPELYGVNAGSNNLTGFTNDKVAAFYLNLASLTGQKLDAAVLATALNVYATTSSLGGAQAQAYGFDVTADGLGASSYNVSANGSAFGVANNTTLSVFALLVDVDSLAVNGVLYNGDKTLRNEAMSVFGVIDSLGGI
jgi:hypothetical protein